MPFAAQGDPSLDLIQKKSDLSVRRQCELLGVTRSRIYHTPKPPNEEAVERKERVMALIDYWHTENPAWGARKIRVLLSAEKRRVLCIPEDGAEVHAPDGYLPDLSRAKPLEAQV